jgi:hypothetical protein
MRKPELQPRPRRRGAPCRRQRRGWIGAVGLLSIADDPARISTTSSTATGTLVTPGSRPHGLPGHQANLQAPRQSSSPSARPPASTAALTTRGTSPTALSRIRHRLGARTGAHRPLSRRRGEGRRTRGDGQPSRHGPPGHLGGAGVMRWCEGSAARLGWVGGVAVRGRIHRRAFLHRGAVMLRRWALLGLLVVMLLVRVGVEWSTHDVPFLGPVSVGSYPHRPRQHPKFAERIRIRCRSWSRIWCAPSSLNTAFGSFATPSARG